MAVDTSESRDVSEVNEQKKNDWDAAVSEGTAQYSDSLHTRTDGERSMKTDRGRARITGEKEKTR